MSNIAPQNATPSSFVKDLLSEASGNCKRDKVVWDVASCGTQARVSSSGDADGGCVALRQFTKANVASIFGSRYSSVRPLD